VGDDRGQYFCASGDRLYRLRSRVGSDAFAAEVHAIRAGAPPEPWSSLAEEEAAADVRRSLLRAKERAQRQSVEFSLTFDDVMGMLSDQDFRCALSRIPFEFYKSDVGSRRPFSPSIDRIEAGKDYSRANTRLVATIVNTARSDFTDDAFFRMCAEITLQCGLLGYSRQKREP
jgi:hypothetical protein